MTDTTQITDAMLDAGYKAAGSLASDHDVGFYFSMASENDVKDALKIIYLAMEAAVALANTAT